MVISIKNIDINYEIYGEEKEGESPLLLLHGWMASIPAMAPIWQYFGNTQNANSRNVIVIDFPGQGGRSSELTEPWGVPEYAEMVREFMQELNIEKPDVIGHSFGGRVVIYLASNYPDIFNKIILTDSAGVKHKTTMKKWIKTKSFKIGKAFLKLTSNQETYENKLKKLREKYGSTDYASLKSDVMRETFKKVINLDLTENLKEIKSPCLLIWGENDKDTPLYMAKIMERKIKDSGLVVLKNAGHFSYLDSPYQYNTIVENFLNNLV